MKTVFKNIKIALTGGKNDVIMFFAHFFGFYLLIFFGRVFTTASSLNFAWYQGYQIVCALVFALICALYSYNIKNTVLMLGVAVVWFVAALCKSGAGMVLPEREIVQTIELGVIFYAIIATLHYVLKFKERNFFCRVLKILNYMLFGLVMLMPLLVIGYYVVSDKHMLSANILLTLFQTNYDEVVSYLVEQNMVLWAISVVTILMFVGIFIFALHHVKREENCYKTLIIIVFCLIYVMFSVLPKLSSSFIINMVVRVADTLSEYAEYDKISAARDARITQLQTVLKYDDEPQLHVLVVGESTVRHHLSAFGYERKTTPWLDEVVNNDKNAILFHKAYSNNIQTVMSVQFMLTSQNQYDNSALVDAYSLTEVATAAGFDTYWISNQMHHNAYDSPIKTVSNGANNRTFINDFYGNKLLTTYYDDKLADFFPSAENGGKVFVVFHLMGCHNVYNDRYPENFATFTDGNDERVDAYDNCILYNDYVLSKLYEKAVQNPNFMSFTFLSDHGEDPDAGLTHDYSKFTWNMAHIPFFSVFSEKYARQNPQILAILKANSNKYWTSDLLYNEMLHIMGISNAPGENDEFDISSAKYGMNRDNLTIIEHSRHISDDKD